MTSHIPACFGRYDASQCPWQCSREIRWECLDSARLSQEREANRLARRWLREVPPERRHLLRLGYPAGVLLD